jgi:Kinesin motor domain
MDVKTIEDANKLVRRAGRSRKKAQTEMNESSSSSHMVLSIYVQKAREAVSTRLEFVDLAGSECLKQISAHSKTKQVAI